MPETSLKVELLSHTPEPDLTAATAGHICYANATIDELKKKVTPDYAKKLISHLVEAGHFSVLEHVSFTFGIEGISRACSHQLVRHRIASYSQQSQRYVDEESFNYIVPPKIKSNPSALKKFTDSIESSRKAYVEMLEISPKEDARFLLPNAAETRIVVTMNTRSLYNFFEHRLCTRAQWEIRQLAEAMLEECKKVAPLLFNSVGPKCERLGYCTEKKSCGRKPSKTEFFKKN